MAGTILYLASRAGGYAHGQEIVIDFTGINPSRAWVLKYMKRQTWMLSAYISNKNTTLIQKYTPEWALEQNLWASVGIQ